MNPVVTTMKELPVTERPYEKCAAGGPGILSDAELLAVILKSGCRGMTALELSQQLLLRSRSGHPLADITRSTLKELTAIPGIGTVKAIQLQCLGELSGRMAKENARERICMTSAASIADYFMEDLCHLEHEEIWAALFDTKNHLLRAVTLSKGTVNASVISPREVFLAALRHQAVFLILLHNHPSGDPSPSREDILLTHRMVSAGEILGISLLDHIIFGDHCYFSLKERNMI